jgi:class 3 adenylate cyclase
VIGEGGDIYGEGVNIAARLEALAEPGGVCVSANLFEEARGKLAAAFEDLGERPVKNLSRPVRAHRVLPAAAGDGGAPAPAPPSLTTSPTAWSRTSSPSLRACPGCS